jgi:hypothetical protein
MTWVVLWVGCEWTKKSTQDREVRGAACCRYELRLGPIEAAPVAYDVVSFLPTQTSSTRLVVFGK